MTRAPVTEDMYDIALPEQPEISPDASEIVYVLRTADRDTDQDARALWIVPVAGGAARRLTRGTADTAPAWSPDGTRIAFLRSTEDPVRPQLWVLPVDGGEAEQVTVLPLGAGPPVWSPDGASIAFAAPVDPAGAQAGAAAPIVADRLGFKADGTGRLGAVCRHLHVLRLDTRTVRQITSGDWHAGDPAWSPDGTRLAFPAAPEADSDLTLRSGAYVVDVDINIEVEVGGRAARPRLVGPGAGRAASVAWTADGRALLVVGRTDTAAGHAGLLRVPLTGGPALDLARPLDRNVLPGLPAYPGALPRLARQGGSVLFCARDRGDTRLYGVALDGGMPHCLVGGDTRTVCGMSVSGDVAAIVLGTSTSYGEIATVDVRTGALSVRTAHRRAEIEPVVPEEREFTVSDGTVVHGWLLRAPAHDAPGPLLLDIHGGPHNAWNGAADPAHLYHQVLAARGWAVLLLNPRGSDGYGEAFYTAAVGAWGQADVPDLLEPIDQLVAEGVADPARLAVGGYSYGGFMTCCLTGRDSRFAAAIAGGVVSDPASMAGTSDAAHEVGVREFGAPPWADHARYAALSPLARVQAVATPTLIVHGAADDRCPVGQAEQWFTALRERGVPTRLVLYPGAAHLFPLFGRPSHRVDLNRRIVDWVERYTADPGRPRRAPLDATHWQRRLTELAEIHQVPGAALGILRMGPAGADEEYAYAHCGVLNAATGVTVTDDSLFQIGSITKVWTATVVMQLVEEGILDLDAPIVDVLPELRLADPEVTRRVTMRHLLTHTSGIDGDIFTDTGRGDDCLARYVDLLDRFPHNHPLGATFSYSNAGYSLAGRVIERLTGRTWDVALRERLIVPLGLTHTVTLPEETLLFRAAVGHLVEDDGAPHPVPVWAPPRSIGPGGLICATAADVLAFARCHLTGGRGPDGTRLLSEASVAAMGDKQADLPDPHSLGDSWGLGWMRFGWGGRRLIGHDGNTTGQSGFLRLLPEQGLAVALLTNGGHARDLYEDFYPEVFGDLAGVTVPRPLAPSAEPPAVDTMRHVGVYEREGVRIEVLDRAGGLRFRYGRTGAFASLLPGPEREFDLVAVRDGLFAYRQPGLRTWTPVTFYTLPTGEPYVHCGARATPKISGGGSS